MIVDHVFIFKLEGNNLTGTRRAFLTRTDKDGNQKLESDKYIPLPELSVNGTTITWKQKMTVLQVQSIDTLSRVTLISDDEILVEYIGQQIKKDESGRTELVVPVSYKLKREK